MDYGWCTVVKPGGGRDPEKPLKEGERSGKDKSSPLLAEWVDRPRKAPDVREVIPNTIGEAGNQ